MSALHRSLVAALIVIAAAAYLWSVDRDLPFAPESDEVDFLTVVGPMVTEGDPNPHWFGHPGSPFIYAYAAALWAWSETGEAGAWLRGRPVPDDEAATYQTMSILIGRLVSVGFAVLAVWMTCLVGDRAFGPPVGLIGAWLALLSPLTLDHVDMARTDSAGLFFGLLGTWALLRLWQEPSRAGHVVAGLAIGAAIATRYFLIALVPLLLVVDVALWRAADPDARGETRSGAVLGGLSVLVGFAACAPFVVLDLGEVLANLAHEARAEHPGADGLGPLGNLSFYLTTAFPRSVPAPILALSVVGALVACRDRRLEPLLLLGFVAIFLGGISLATLHWGRWLIQVLPVVALFAAAGLVWGVGAVSARWVRGETAAALLLVVVVLGVSAGPAASFVRHVRLQATPSTREIARAWIVANLSPDERITADLYTAPLQRTPFAATEYVFSLAQIADRPADLARRGYDVAMVSSAVYRRFFAAPERYPRETAFYRTLFRKHERLAEFRPGADGRGPVIRLYRLPPGP